jgi:transcriptional regulator with XRE-family HTH domain
LGITFQQMYKYEKARNRISAGRLYGLSKALDVPVTFFFDGLIGTDAPVGRKRKDPR